VPGTAFPPGHRHLPFRPLPRQHHVLGAAPSDPGPVSEAAVLPVLGRETPRTPARSRCPGRRTGDGRPWIPGRYFRPVLRGTATTRTLEKFPFTDAGSPLKAWELMTACCRTPFSVRRTASAGALARARERGSPPCPRSECPQISRPSPRSGALLISARSGSFVSGGVELPAPKTKRARTCPVSTDPPPAEGDPAEGCRTAGWIPSFVERPAASSPLFSNDGPSIRPAAGGTDPDPFVELDGPGSYPISGAVPAMGGPPGSSVPHPPSNNATIIIGRRTINGTDTAETSVLRTAVLRPTGTRTLRTSALRPRDARLDPPDGCRGKTLPPRWIDASPRVSRSTQRSPGPGPRAVAGRR